MRLSIRVFPGANVNLPQWIDNLLLFYRVIPGLPS
jgi:hypothetical protein